ncbi:CocE/NonD family hydrolase [Polyangium sp. 6x1]|uniref:CocE/NonD family hydrolase n=1 Tax=Polyangium sp. 6x1 TaxID=3042689 RepID=UPI00248231B3|nr:CocE/NonD family hydrolase [Polyangium sp. 6x1]MDI1447490.1 CocE/NonD family hydrolase [Polyangium sp. 6x1]
MQPFTTLPSHLLEWLLDLPPAETRDIVVEQDLQIPMRDGAVLLADLHAPQGAGKRPLILLRSPYGRRNPFMSLLSRPFAERGFSVLIQSCRGTFGSGGKLDPFRNERDDGLATLAWLEKQPWFSGDLATFGPSYLGFVQWAIARDAGPMLKAMSPQVTLSDFRSFKYPGETFSLDSMLRWSHLMHGQEKPFFEQILARRADRRALERAFAHLPLAEVDQVLLGQRVGYFQEWLEHNAPGDPWWEEVNYSGTVAEVTAPALFTAGYYDIFLPWQLKDYAALVAAGRKPYLTIGPWSHASLPSFTTSLRESIAWFRAHMLGDRSLLREAPVRIYVMGANEWREYPSWPPPGVRTERHYLQPNGGLSPVRPAASPPDHYRYDPADPTPSVGGPLLSEGSGPTDNRALEARRDVLTYTTLPLERSVEVIGPVSAELFVHSSLPHTDFFVRLCDVDPSGRSINICDGILRLAPGRPAPRPDGTLAITIELWPTAHRFRRNHRIRVQVSSGAHPRFARNPGSGEPLATATRLIAADQTVHHDPARPSAIVLSVLG